MYSSEFGCQFIDDLSCKGDIAPSLWVSIGADQRESCRPNKLESDSL